MKKEVIINRDKLGDDAGRLANAILRRSLDATDYRVDVAMNGHGGSRTTLSDEEFGSLSGAIQHAMDNSSSTHFRLERLTGNRLNGEPYVYYYIIFL